MQVPPEITTDLDTLLLSENAFSKDMDKTHTHTDTWGAL